MAISFHDYLIFSKLLVLVPQMRNNTDYSNFPAEGNNMYTVPSTFKAHLRRASALAVALLVGVSLSACGSGNTDSKPKAQEKTASVKEIRKLTKNDFKVLDGKQLGPVTAAVHELNTEEKQQIIKALEQLGSTKDQLLVEPKECEELAKQIFSPGSQYVDSIDTMIMAGNALPNKKPNMISLSTDPAQSTLKVYSETDKLLVSKCPKYSLQLPGNQKMEFSITPFTVEDYSDIASSIIGYQVESSMNGKQAYIEIVLKTNQTMQVMSDSPENAKKTLADAFKLLKLR